ncbi:helix-turn-helix transcriptional regulator [Nocardioides sp. GY 10113]|uniref:helix-turn-helix domain-containing protein n=1 Tax=Nocardioides sp. GY 10113 TaxID=2569761 RepID=UPI0014580633|nr:helix-turn-helix transcriptional regulator [Nocardioides sp. GY 10113]
MRLDAIMLCFVHSPAEELDLRSSDVVASPKTGDLELGRTIAARRTELGMSRKELAEATGLSYPYVAQIETGYRLPSSRHQVPIAKALGLSLDELFSTGMDVGPGASSRTTRSRKPSLDEAVEAATAAIDALPVAVRLEALSRVQLNVMTSVTQAQPPKRNQ